MLIFISAVLYKIGGVWTTAISLQEGLWLTVQLPIMTSLYQTLFIGKELCQVLNCSHFPDQGSLLVDQGTRMLIKWRYSDVLWFSNRVKNMLFA